MDDEQNEKRKQEIERELRIAVRHAWAGGEPGNESLRAAIEKAMEESPELFARACAAEPGEKPLFENPSVVAIWLEENMRTRGSN